MLFVVIGLYRSNAGMHSGASFFDMHHSFVEEAQQYLPTYIQSHCANTLNVYYQGESSEPQDDAGLQEAVVKKDLGGASAAVAHHGQLKVAQYTGQHKHGADIDIA